MPCCMAGNGRVTACPTWLLLLLYELQAIIDVLQRQVTALHGPQCCIFLQAFQDLRQQKMSCHIDRFPAVAYWPCRPSSICCPAAWWHLKHVYARQNGHMPGEGIARQQSGPPAAAQHIDGFLVWSGHVVNQTQSFKGTSHHTAVPARALEHPSAWQAI